jgi:lysophospholipase L1-like esterase
MLRIIVVLFVLQVGIVAYAAEPKSLVTRSAEEEAQVVAAREAVQKDPAVKAASEKFKAARKAYQLDRAKFPNERDRQVSVDYRKATNELEAATVAAMTARDPALAAILKKAPRKRNEGETAADYDGAKNPAVQPIVDVPGLPRVLLIGDSISIGYTLQVRELLKGRANVHRIPVNGGATEVGIENLKDWLDDGPWDVIHFNFGLHDAKYLSETEQRATREQYVANLATILKSLKATNAKLIFATTTPTPKVLSRPTRKFDSIEERNALAVKLMAEQGVAIDDLHAVVVPVQEKIQRPRDVHFTPEGYDVLAKRVAESIAAQLTK